MLAGRRSPFRHACSEVSVCREGWRRRRGGDVQGRLQPADMAQELRIGCDAQAPHLRGLAFDRQMHIRKAHSDPRSSQAGGRRRYYNLERSHQGYRLKRRTPTQVLREALSIDVLPPIVPEREVTTEIQPDTLRCAALSTEAWVSDNYQTFTPLSLIDSNVL